MVRIGKFTGKEYHVGPKEISECCINVDEKSEFYKELKEMSYPRPECQECRGCPEYQHSEGTSYGEKSKFPTTRVI